ncbi:MAG: hypothetical protein H7832_01415 [Magnetococcus sp. DMHC-6]
MAATKEITTQAMIDYVSNVPDEYWNQFCELMDQEHIKREAELRTKAIHAAKEAANKYGFAAEELFGLSSLRTNTDHLDDDDKVPSSALVKIKEMAPEGLYNPNAPEGKQKYYKPADKDRWVRVPEWLKNDLTAIKEKGGRFNSHIIKSLCDKYPMTI